MEIFKVCFKNKLKGHIKYDFTENELVLVEYILVVHLGLVRSRKCKEIPRWRVPLD